MPIGNSNPAVQFDEEYIEACFRAWYKAGAPKLTTPSGVRPAATSRIVAVLPVAKDGRKAKINTVRKWMKKYDWESRREALDAEVSIRLDEEAIQERIKVLRELADTGQSLMDKGLEYILKEPDPFRDNPSAAVRAIVAGSDMKFKYAAQADILANVAGMTDRQITKEINALLGLPDSENEDEDTVTVDAEEIEETQDDDEPEGDNP